MGHFDVAGIARHSLDREVGESLDHLSRVVALVFDPGRVQVCSEKRFSAEYLRRLGEDNSLDRREVGSVHERDVRLIHRDRPSHRSRGLVQGLDQAARDQGPCPVVHPDQADGATDRTQPCHLTGRARRSARNQVDLEIEVAKSRDLVFATHEDATVNVVSNRGHSVCDQGKPGYQGHELVAAETETAPGCHHDHDPVGHRSEGTFVPVVTSEDLRRLAGSVTGRLLVDADGRLMDQAGIAGDAHVPGLVVTPITEAVKKVDSGKIVHYLSRDTLWGVEGFLLDRRVIDSLPDGIQSGSGLIDAVREAGFAWQVVV